MYFRIFSFAILFVLMTSGSFAQATASASVSVNIISLVGAESGGNISFTDIKTPERNPMMLINTSNDDLTILARTESSETTVAASFKIIGSSQLYDIDVQKDPVLISDKEGNEVFRIDRFAIASAGKSKLNLNEENFSIAATLRYSEGSLEPGHDFRPSFNITVNFN